MFGFFAAIKQRYFPKPRNLFDWYVVTFDDTHIYRNVQPPGGKDFADQLAWADITRVCFEATDFMVSDDLYLFTSQREESYLIPLDGQGGAELWLAILERGMFDHALAITAASSISGVFCWPAADE